MLFLRFYVVHSLSGSLKELVKIQYSVRKCHQENKHYTHVVLDVSEKS